jgi:hypothetical protein
MDKPIIGKGTSMYKHKKIFDRDIAYLVGINTYSCLYHDNPDIWYKVVDPMPSPVIMLEVFQPLVVDGFDSVYIKQQLVQYEVDKVCNISIKTLIGSSEPPLWFWTSTWTEVISIILQFLFLIYVTWLLFYFNILDIGIFHDDSTIQSKMIVDI